MRFVYAKKYYTREEDCWTMPISPASEAQVHRALRSEPKVCILTDDDGSYLQVGRSGFCCCLEWHDTKSRRHSRGFQHLPVVPWPGITRIFLLAGELSLMQEEYFSPQQATEALLTFLQRLPFPAYIQWRDIASELNAKACTLFQDRE